MIVKYYVQITLWYWAFSGCVVGEGGAGSLMIFMLPSSAELGLGRA